MWEPIQKITKAKTSVGVVQVVELLGEAFSSNLKIAKKKKRLYMNFMAALFFIATI
jgi:hypothetical protein